MSMTPLFKGKIILKLGLVRQHMALRKLYWHRTVREAAHTRVGVLRFSETDVGGALWGYYAIQHQEYGRQSSRVCWEGRTR